MLKEIRKIKGRPKQVRFYFLMNTGLLPKHTNESGYVCYDTEEFKAYQKTHKKGRPAKIK